MSAGRESLLLGKFATVFTHLSNPSKDFGGDRLFQLDLDEALVKDAASWSSLLYLDCSRPLK